jgi:RNA polymerase sigma factor (sigma-70 family)
MHDDPSDPATQAYVHHRELLFSIVYNLLGSVYDTEDVLQETWLAWAARRNDARAEPIENPRGYLVRIAVNQALARQAAIRRRRETYVGPWLPEPLVADQDTADRVVSSESVSLAVLVVLEALSPLERAVFVLHEVFGYPLVEVAGILDRTPEAVRQLGRRARAHVHARRPRFRSDPQVQRRVTEQFLAAALGGDLVALMRLLAPDVTLWSDGGGKSSLGGPRPVHGRDKVARLIAGTAPETGRRVEVRYRRVNQDPAAILFDGDAPLAVMVLDLTADGSQVQDIYTVSNPEKLSRSAPERRPGRR